MPIEKTPSPDETPGEELPEELTTIEAALRRLTPLAGRLDRDRLMYLAGQASVLHSSSQIVAVDLARRSTRLPRYGWQLATAALALICVTLGGLLLREPRAEEHVVYVDHVRVGGAVDGSGIASSLPAEKYAVNAASLRGNSNYFQLRNRVLTRGVDALPATPVFVVPQLQPTIHAWPILQHDLFGRES